MHWQYAKRPDGKIAVTLDNNVWDLLFEKEIDLALELPSEEFSIFIPREIEIETLAIPADANKLPLKDYIDRTIKNCGIRTTSNFGFARNDPEPERNRGFGQGTFRSQTNGEFYEAIKQYLLEKGPRKSRLKKNEGDAAVAASSFSSIVLTCERPNKSGPLLTCPQFMYQGLC